MYLPFTVEDKWSPYYVIILKSLDVLTTWMFLRNGLTESNPFVRHLINIGGISYAGLVTTGGIFIYCIFLRVVWIKTQTIFEKSIWKELVEYSCDLSLNVGIIIHILVPIWNISQLYLCHTLRI